MPGVLKRTHDEADPTEAASIQDGERPSKRQATGMPNGELPPNGYGLVNGGSHHNDAPLPADLISSTIQEFEKNGGPPELFHITQGFIPLSTMAGRVAQETHNTMEELIAELADSSSLKVAHEKDRNGNDMPTRASAEANVAKKNKLWDFAQLWRAKFIKLYVLSQWSRNAEAISKIIDINFFLMQQRGSYREAVNWMGELKRILMPEKLPAPNLKTAIEVLSTGKAAWISDFGYISPKHLSPKELLASLRTLNSLLTIRLTTQENVPPQLANWTVKSGRATFNVQDEFELDLSIADEDPSSQFYFIDFRFLFSPVARTLAEGPLRNHIEWKANDILRREGLLGCFEFLHEFTLEHKLTTLRNQTRDLVRGDWKDDTLLRASSRGLVVQYWAQRPGKKNWIEIAVNSGKSKRHYSSQPATSCLSVRWHRHGVEVRDDEIELDVAHLSMERILKEVIARHLNYIFKEIKRKLKGSKVHTAAHLTVKHRAHVFEPQECSLTVQLSSKKAVKIEQDFVSGRFLLSPPFSLSVQCEAYLNSLKDPAADSAPRLEVLRCLHTLDYIQAKSRAMGWKLNNMYNVGQSTMLNLFGSDRLRYNFYTVAAWPPDFILAITSSMDGDKLWVIETQDVPKNITPEDWAAGVYQPLKQALEIPHFNQSVVVLEPDVLDLVAIENLGSLMISQLVDIRMLKTRNAEFEQRPTARAHPRRRVPELWVRFPTTTAPEEPVKPKIDHSWSNGTFKFSYTSVSRSRKEVVLMVLGRLRKPRPDIQALTKRMDSSLAFHPSNGDFAFTLRSEIGHGSIAAVEEKLYRLAALVEFLEIASEHALACTQVSLTSMTFQYSTAAPSGPISVGDEAPLEQLTATINAPLNEKMQISFAKGNPHLYIADFLTRELEAPNGLNTVANILRLTLPALNIVARIDAQHAARADPPVFHFLPRSATCYVARYSNKSTFLELEIRHRDRHRDRRGVVIWLTLVRAGRIKPESAEPASKSDNTGKNISAPLESSKANNKSSQNSSSTKKDPKSTANAKGSKKDSETGKDDDKGTPQDSLLSSLSPEAILSAWDSLLHERNNSWTGIGKGLCVDPIAIDAALTRVDEVFTDLFVKAPDENPAPEASPVAQKTGGDSKPSPQKRPPDKDAEARKPQQPPTQPPNPSPKANNSTSSKITNAPPTSSGKPNPPPNKPGLPSARPNPIPGLPTSNAQPKPNAQPNRPGVAATANMQPNRPANKPPASTAPMGGGNKRTADMMAGSGGNAPVAGMGQGSVKKKKGNPNTGPGGGGGGGRGGEREVITLD